MRTPWRFLIILIYLLPVSVIYGQGEVMWQSLNGVTYDAAKKKLQKTAATGWGNAGAISYNVLASGEVGNLSFTIPADHKACAIGLSKSNPDNNFTSILYGFYFSGSQVIIIESGASIVNLGAWNVEDKYVIQRNKEGKIEYYQNDIQVHTTPTAGTERLFVDVAIKHKFSYIPLIYISFDINCLTKWHDYVGIANDQKEAVDGWGNAGAVSVNRLGEYEPGSIVVFVDGSLTFSAIGYSSVNEDAHYTAMDHALLFNSVSLNIVEGGAVIGSFGMWRTDQSYAIERNEEGTVTYWRNDTLIYTSGRSTVGELMTDIAMYTQYASIPKVYTRHGCHKTTYYDLKRELDAGYYHTLKKRINFKYDEEYEPDQGKRVIYNIYSKNRSLLASVNEPGTASPITSPNALSRFGTGMYSYYLGNLGLTVGEYYVLEVINRKNESMFLRFMYENNDPNHP